MFGSILDMGMTGVNNMWADERQEDAQQHAHGIQTTAHAFQRDSENTFFQRRMNDLRQAGLNPMLAYMSSANTHASGVGGAAGIASPGHSSSIASGLQSAAQTSLIEAQERRVDAEIRNLDADTAEKLAKAPTHAVSIDQMRQNISESIERMREIGARITLHGSTAAHADQQVKNLHESISLIREQVRQARALTTVHHAHAVESGARTSQAEAVSDETRQRIRANIPALEAALKQLETQAQRLSMHGRGMDAAANASFLGAWRAALRALTGQQTVLGK